MAVSTFVTWQRFASTGLPETLEDSQPDFGLDLKDYYSDSTTVVNVVVICCYLTDRRLCPATQGERERVVIVSC